MLAISLRFFLNVILISSVSISSVLLSTMSQSSPTPSLSPSRMKKQGDSNTTTTAHPSTDMNITQENKNSLHSNSNMYLLPQSSPAATIKETGSSVSGINTSLSQYPLDNDKKTENLTALNQTRRVTARPITMNTTRDPHYGHNHNEMQPPPAIFYICLILAKVVLFVVGVTGNIMIIATIVKTKSMHKQMQNYFVFNLAVTDLFILLVYLPYNIYKLLITAWPFGEFACRYLLPITDIVPSISILTLVAISIDRYRAITGTLTQTLSIKWTVVLLVFLWVGCYLIVALPVSFVMVYILQRQICYVNFQSSTQAKVYYTLRCVFFYVLPSIAIFFCYIRVNKALGNSIRFLQRSVTGKSQMIRLKRQKRVMSMFFAIFLTFAVCFLPFNVLIMLFNYAPQIQQYTAVLFYSMKLASVIAIANSVCNPVILYTLSRVFRVKFQCYLPFLKWCSRRHTCKDSSGDAVSINNEKRRETIMSDVLDTPDQNTSRRRISQALLLMSPSAAAMKRKLRYQLNRRRHPQLHEHEVQIEQEDDLLENNNAISNEEL